MKLFNLAAAAVITGLLGVAAAAEAPKLAPVATPAPASVATPAPASVATPVPPPIETPPLVDPAAIDSALKSLIDARQIVGVSALVYERGKEAYFGAFGHADR